MARSRRLPGGWRAAATLGLLAALLALGAGWIAHARDMRALEGRLAAGAQTVATAAGPMAYAAGGQGGQGAPVLVLHGAGGGHDQGRLMAEAFLPQGSRWIAPSRFGYPGTPLPADPSTAAQADALAALLDALGLERVTLLAMSGGAPPALQFALRHPARTEALILIAAAPYAPLTAAGQALPVPLWLYDALFASDAPLWALLRLAPHRLRPVVDAREDLVARMTPREAAFLDAMIAGFLPATQRRDGLANEGAAIDPAAPIDPAGIAAPTLILHARDDRIAPVSTARHTGARIAAARTILFDSGGHLLLGHHDAVRKLIAGFRADTFATARDPAP